MSPWLVYDQFVSDVPKEGQLWVSKKWSKDDFDDIAKLNPILLVERVDNFADDAEMWEFKVLQSDGVIVDLVRFYLVVGNPDNYMFGGVTCWKMNVQR